MVTVDSLAVLAAEPVRADAYGAFRDGSVLEARVVAMLEPNLARLVIAGQTIDAVTPIAFQAGTTLPVSIDTSGGSLKLLVQATAVQASAAKTAPPPAPTVSLGPLIDAVQAAITNALLTAELKLAAQAPEQPATQTPSQAAQQAAGQPVEAQPQALAQILTAPAAPLQTGGPASAGPSVIAQQLASPSAADPRQLAQAQAPYPQSPLAAPAQNSAQAVTMPFYIPQMPYSVEARIERETEDGEEGGGAEQSAARGWTVSLSIDGGALGLVHVSVGFRANAVSVRLAADDAQAAERLRAWLPELKAALEDADFAVDELSARQDAAYDRPYRSRSITL